MRPEVRERALEAAKGLRAREAIVDAVLSVVPDVLLIQSPDRVAKEQVDALNAMAEREGIFVIALPKGWEANMEATVEINGERYVRLPT